MRRAAALGLVILLAGLTALALLAPWPVAAGLTLLAVPLLRTGRRAFVLLAATSLLVNALLLALVLPGPRALDLGPVALGLDGALRGLAGGVRLTAALGANLAILAWVGAARLLDGLRLPARPTAMLGAVALSAHDVGADFRRLRTARLLDGGWPAGRWARARAAAALVPHLMLAAHRRARTRREALRLAGHDTPAWFVPVVAVAALAAAGRMAFLALPNVALTYVVVFLGGLLFGPLAGALGAALGMLVTDLLLTGLYVPALVNVPAMSLLGLAGALLRRVDFDGPTRAERVAGLVLAASLGVLGTFAFSAAADLATWVLVAGAEPGALAPLLLAGLAFNLLPAAVNGTLFAAAVGPTVRAFRAAGPGGRPPARTPAPASSTEAAPPGARASAPPQDPTPEPAPWQAP